MDILLVMAVVPAAALLYYVYKIDPVEKEPGRLLARLLGWGAAACIPAIVLETVGMEVFMGGHEAYSISELLFENFIVIALSEELCKFFFLRWKTWKNPAFDYVFDGIVYAVFVSLGFAILENIGYVYEFGFATAVVRAFTAIPGHAIFGVFMGCFYGLAKRAEQAGNSGQKWALLACAIIIPVLCHGFYDFCASISALGDNALILDLMFWIFLLIIMAVAMYLVKHMSKKAHPVHSGAYGQAPAQMYGQPYDQVYGQPFSQPYVQDGYNPVIDNSLDSMQQGYAAPYQYSDAIRSAAPAPASSAISPAPAAPQVPAPVPTALPNATPQQPTAPGFDPNNPYVKNGYNPNAPKQ